MTLNDQIENFAITQDVAKEARNSLDEFKRLDRRIAALEEALRKVLLHCDVGSDGHTEYERAVDAARALLSEGA